MKLILKKFSIIYILLKGLKVNNMKRKVFKIYRKAMVINSLYLYVSTFVQIYIATIVGGFFNEAIAGNTSTIIKSGVTFLGIIAVVTIVQWLLSNYTKLLNEKSSMELRKYIFNKFLLSSFQNIEKFSSGEIINRFKKDIHTISDLFKDSYVVVFTGVLSLGTYFIVLANLNMTIALIILAIGLIPIISPIIFQRIFSKIFYDMREIEEMTSETLMDAIKGIEHIKINNLYDFFKEKYHYCMKSYLEQGLKAEGTIAIQDGLEQGFDKISYIMIYIVFAYYIFKGYINVGQVVTGIFLSRQIINSMMDVLNQYINIVKSKISFKRIENILMPEIVIGIEDINAIDKIEIRNLIFSYNEEKKILNNIFLTINKGEKIAILGGNGKGKSTLIKILLKLYEEYEGDITIDGKNLKNISAASYRNRLCWCPQHTTFFFDKVEENLHLSGNVQKEEIIKLLNKFNLPNNITEKKWQELSGGQKQKLSLIRSLTKDGDVVILDEPSNYLDKDGIEELKNILMQDKRTVVLITHNEDLLEIANRKYVMGT